MNYLVFCNLLKLGTFLNQFFFGVLLTHATADRYT
jgi:hypothetical protein